jgi:predicted nucleic acid-binding protein
MANHESTARVVVCDAGPLIHLDELGSIDLLTDFAEILVPSVVWKEVEGHRPTALNHPDVALRRIVSSGPLPADLQATARLLALHRGELRALQIARRQNADLLLTDDTAARLAARILEIPVHGTVGVLLRAIRRGHRTTDEVVALLHTLPTVSSLHIKRPLLLDIIRGVKESASD